MYECISMRKGKQTMRKSRKIDKEKTIIEYSSLKSPVSIYTESKKALESTSTLHNMIIVIYHKRP